MGVGKREEEESKLLWRQQFPFISICKGLGELQMEAAQAGSLLGLKIELCSTFPAEAPGRAEGVRTQVARGEETDQVIQGGEPRGDLSQERTPGPPPRPAQPDPGSGKVKARWPVSPGGRGQPAAFTRSEDGVAVPRRTAFAATGKEWGGEAGRVEGWAAAAGTGIPDTGRRRRSGAPPRLGWVCVLRAGLRAGPGRTAGRGEGAAFSCDSGLTQCHF